MMFSKRSISMRRKIVFAGGRREEWDGKGKTPSSLREIVLLDQAVEPLKRLIARSQAQGSVYVVAGERKHSMSMSTWNRVIRAAKNDLGDTNVFPAHAWRHLFASVLFASGMSIDNVATQMGHSTPVVTRRIYVHVIAISQAELAKKLSAQVTKLVAETSESED